MRKPTRQQLMLLWVVDHNGPVTSTDVDHHLYLLAGTARGRLGTLSRRGLIDRYYTLGAQIMYVVSTDGRQLLAQMDDDFAEELGEG